MTEHPILMNGEMVRAILDGRKTQHWLPMKPQPERDKDHIGSWTWVPKHARYDKAVGWCPRCVWANGIAPMDSGASSGLLELSPFGGAGDVLWVRETWRPVGPWEWRGHSKPTVQYRADKKLLRKTGCPDDFRIRERDGRDKWRQANHMPRWAARTFLRVKRVWVERVQEISEADAIAEGFPDDGEYKSWCPDCRGDGVVGWSCDSSRDCRYVCRTPAGAFRALWDSIYATKPGLAWDDNPWVWACEFEVKP